MILTILEPTSRRTMEIEWVDVHTIEGSRVILPGHERLIVQLLPQKPISIGLSGGAISSMPINNGLISVTKEEILLILDN